MRLEISMLQCSIFWWESFFLPDEPLRVWTREQHQRNKNNATNREIPTLQEKSTDSLHSTDLDSLFFLLD